MSLFIKKVILIFFLGWLCLFGASKFETEPPFLKNGERLKFKVSYLGIIGGYAEFSFKDLINNIVRMELTAKTEEWTKNVYTLNLSHVSYAKKDNFQILKHIEVKNENNRYYNGVQFFYPQDKYFIFSDRDRERIFKRIKVEYPYDWGLSIVGAFYYMRTYKDLEVGKKYELNAFIRENYRKLVINVVRREVKDTFYGKKKVIVIAPVTDFKGFINDQEGMEIFISDDEYRLPLVMESKLFFGKIKALLVEPEVYPSDTKKKDA